MRLARQCGFDAVECHWPYRVPADRLRQALSATGLPMLAINTRPGDLDAGEFGLAAIPEKQQLARNYIDEAVDYAARIQCRNVHVMAGKTATAEGARSTYLENLKYACDRAAAHRITILIEPINTRDVPGYYLNTVESAVEVLKAAEYDNLKIMFDFYHIQIMQGDLICRLKSCFDHIGHLQMASVPDRAEPDGGEINYASIIEVLGQMDYSGYIGAEYSPSKTIDDLPGWLKKFRSIKID